MRVMVVTPYLPHRRVGHGGGTAVRDLVTWLARRHEVLVASLLRPDEADLVADVTALGVQVETLPYRDTTTRGAGRLLLAVDRLRAWLNSLRSGYPLYVEKYHTADAVSWLGNLVDEFSPEAIQFEYLQTALLCRSVHRRRNGDRPRLVLNSHELGSLPRERRAAAATGGARRRARREAAAWRHLQVDACGWADCTLCVTEQDRELYAAMGGHDLLTVPLGMDTEAIVPVWEPPATGPGEYLFVGSFQHGPNRRAAELLVHRIWPAVANRLPGATLLLAGRGSRRFLDGTNVDSAAVHVRALGFVDDLTELFLRCRLFLAPLPEGGGIKIKILEAMARGIPVVTTPVGAEGIATSGDDVIVIAEPDTAAFADAVVAAAADPDACRKRAARARSHLEAHYSWESITGRLAEIYQGS
ncbi:MAG: glycosyltransferase family 4 protein [bacterium]|nr:glycosyltransferase family 4 protein [bacterium]